MSRRTRRVALAVAALAAIAVLVPAEAQAHAVPGVDYRFPLPVWLYAVAAAAAVLASAPAAALAVRPQEERTGPDLYRVARPLRLGAIGTAVVSLLFLDALVGGFGGPDEFFENPMTVLTWIDFWVGLAIVSVLVGNVWDFVSPLNALGRALDRRFAERGAAVYSYPERLGVWPATVLLLVWSWMELVWDDAKTPRVLAFIAIAYVVVQLVAVTAFGAETWLARGELFTVVARTFARFAPLELYVRAPAGPCPAGRGEDPERAGCPACWLAADPDDRGVRLRSYGSGARREAALGAGGGAFVVALLATVVFDGFTQTQRYADLEGYVFERVTWLGAHTTLFGTLVMLGVVALFTLAFLAVTALVGRRESGSAAAGARRYAPTLIPIAAVYFVSHYFLYAIYAGQFSWAAMADPFGKEWVPDASPWTGVPGAAVWYTQVVLIVWGHVAAVFEAHRVSLTAQERPRAAVLAQAPLVVLMVAYTFSGLWVLGQVLSGA